MKQNKTIEKILFTLMLFVTFMLAILQTSSIYHLDGLTIAFTGLTLISYFELKQ